MNMSLLFHSVYFLMKSVEISEKGGIFQMTSSVVLAQSQLPDVALPNSGTDRAEARSSETAALLDSSLGHEE